MAAVAPEGRTESMMTKKDYDGLLSLFTLFVTVGSASERVFIAVNVS